MDVAGVEADGRQAGADLIHEWCWPAEVCDCVARWPEIGEQRRGETSGTVEVATLEVVGVWAAVADVGAHVRERGKERAGFGGEGVVAAAAGAVEPPDLSVGMLLRQGMQHGEDRGNPDACADQQYGRVGLVEDERASR